ncbi:hypothetical protein HK405_000931, partial [Cladochytrium tenue]
MILKILTGASELGGPVAGLLHHCMLQAAIAAEPASSTADAVVAKLFTMRMTVNLYKPVPTTTPCRVTTSLVFSSRSIRHYQASMAPAGSSITTADAAAPAPCVIADCIFLRTQLSDPSVAVLKQIEDAGLDADSGATKPSGIPVFRPLPLRPTLPASTDSPPKLDRLAQFRHPAAHVTFTDALCANFSEDGLATFRGITKTHLAGADKHKPFYPSAMWFALDDGVALIEDRRHLPPEKQLDAGVLGVMLWPSLTDATIMVGDAGSGISGVLDRSKFQYSNIDYTIIFHRAILSENLDPSFPYLCMSSSSRISTGGTGLCRSEFFDARGRVAVAFQNL